MKRNTKLAVFVSIVSAMAIFAAFNRSTAQSGSAYQVTTLIGSSGSGAPHTDSRMVNAWGNAFFTGQPFWINDQGTGVSELIDGAGTIYGPLPFVNVPGPSGAKGQPTGIVANGTADFVLSAGGPALFVFAGEDGIISAWNESMGNNAVSVVNKAGVASYTGLALAKNGSANQLYTANQGVTGHPASIDVYNTGFGVGVASGGFVDSHLPPNFVPYNIQNIGGNLFVSYFEGLQSVGQVDEFDPNGDLIMTFTSSTLAAPWGMTIAPSAFGSFANDLLVGNLVDGSISVFNP
ncbi:MAG TPA: TIGR03118 family protein, partial [Candidatus Binataceae bacterium]|nr:TIGR03118 family protein [Candidatus Binataceae bacterium]